MKQYPVYLLDADQTLFDFHKAEQTAFCRTFEKMTGFSCTGEEFSLYSTINAGLWKAMERGEITKEQIQQQRFCRFLSAVDMRGDGMAWNQYYLDRLSEGNYLLDGALELCRELSGRAALYLATNGIERVQKKRLAFSEIRPFISGIFVSEEMGASKPEPAYFDAVLERISCSDRKKVLMVGDSLSSDILGGIRAGLDTCWYNPEKLPPPENIRPTYQISSLSEIIVI